MTSPRPLSGIWRFVVVTGFALPLVALAGVFAIFLVVTLLDDWLLDRGYRRQVNLVALRTWADERLASGHEGPVRDASLPALPGVRILMARLDRGHSPHLEMLVKPDSLETAVLLIPTEDAPPRPDLRRLAVRVYRATGSGR